MKPMRPNKDYQTEPVNKKKKKHQAIKINKKYKTILNTISNNIKPIKNPPKQETMTPKDKYSKIET